MDTFKGAWTTKGGNGTSNSGSALGTSVLKFLTQRDITILRQYVQRLHVSTHMYYRQSIAFTWLLISWVLTKLKLEFHSSMYGHSKVVIRLQLLYILGCSFAVPRAQPPPCSLSTRTMHWSRQQRGLVCEKSSAQCWPARQQAVRAKGQITKQWTVPDRHQCSYSGRFLDVLMTYTRSRYSRDLLSTPKWWKCLAIPIFDCYSKRPVYHEFCNAFYTYQPGACNGSYNYCMVLCLFVSLS